MTTDRNLSPEDPNGVTTARVSLAHVRRSAIMAPGTTWTPQ
jgi:hypothetical protein